VTGPELEAAPVRSAQRRWRSSLIKQAVHLLARLESPKVCLSTREARPRSLRGKKSRPRTVWDILGRSVIRRTPRHAEPWRALRLHRLGIQAFRTGSDRTA